MNAFCRMEFDPSQNNLFSGEVQQSVLSHDIVLLKNTNPETTDAHIIHGHANIINAIGSVDHQEILINDFHDAYGAGIKLHKAFMYIDPVQQYTYYYFKQTPVFGGGIYFAKNSHLIEVLNYRLANQLQDPRTHHVLQSIATFTKKQNVAKRYVLTGECLNWDSRTYTKCYSEQDIGSSFLNVFLDWYVNAGLVTQVKIGRGDGIIFNNNQVLHGFYPYIGPLFCFASNLSIEKLDD